MRRTKKEKMITRTFKVTLASVMTVNILASEVETIDVSIVGSFSDDDLINEIKKEYETDIIKCVSVMSSYEKDKLMGIPEKDFYRMASELPPRTNEPNEIE